MWDENGKASTCRGTPIAERDITLYLFWGGGIGKSIDREISKLINFGGGKEAGELIKVNRLVLSDFQ